MTIKTLLFPASLIPLAISVISFAQFWPLASGMGTTTPCSGPGTSMRDQGRSRAVFLSGKVVVDEGLPLPESAAIEVNCGRRLYTEGYTDAKGYFSFQLCVASNLLGTDVQEVGVARASHRRTSRASSITKQSGRGYCSLVFWFPLFVLLFCLD